MKDLCRCGRHRLAAVHDSWRPEGHTYEEYEEYEEYIFPESVARDPKRVWLNDVRPAPKPKGNTLYLMGSLRNPNVPVVGNKLRAAGWDVYDDWFAGGPEADDRWKEYELGRGHNFIEALGSHTAHNIFHFDTLHIERCAVGVLLMPAGKSAHLELGDGFTGRGKPGYIITDDPDRFDVMYRFAHGVFADVEAFIETVRAS